MGLLSNEVTIRWNNKNKKWYESKGYIFTKIGDSFIVQISDLSIGSHTEIFVLCDSCKIKNKMIWKDYNRYVKEDGIYICRNCNNKHKNRIIKYQISRLNKSKSFEQWCIDNNRQDVLNRWDYELNDCKPSEICYSVKYKYWFKCPKNIHTSELKDINGFINNHNGCMDCKACNSFAQWGIDNLGEDFLEKYWDYEKNISNPYKINHGSNNKVWIKCQEKDYHESYNISCGAFCSGVRCSYCGYSGKVHILDSLGTLFPKTLTIWSDKNNKTPYEFLPLSAKKVWWKCSNQRHDDYYREINNSTTYNFRCPKCSQEREESYLQEKVRHYLNDFGFKIVHENKCSIVCYNPKTNCLLRYDNEIVELKLIIEVHGIQHYNLNNFHILQSKNKNTTPEYELHMQQVRDRYKRIYAKSKSYEYLEIPYWTDDGNKTWKKIINDKINKIIGSTRTQII